MLIEIPAMIYNGIFEAGPLGRFICTNMPLNLCLGFDLAMCFTTKNIH